MLPCRIASSGYSSPHHILNRWLRTCPPAVLHRYYSATSRQLHFNPIVSPAVLHRAATVPSCTTLHHPVRQCRYENSVLLTIIKGRKSLFVIRLKTKSGVDSLFLATLNVILFMYCLVRLKHLERVDSAETGHQPGKGANFDCGERFAP